MSESRSCQSCSMTIESGELCHHCSDPEGNLISFDECVERFMQWTRRQEPDLPEAEARRKTVEYMGAMPAWKDHPRVRKELA